MKKQIWQGMNEDIAINAAYHKLNKTDKVSIFSSAMRLVNYVDDRCPEQEFDFYDALEVLAKTGIWMVKLKCPTS